MEFRVLAVPSLVVALTIPSSSGAPALHHYTQYMFFYQFASALTRKGECALPYNDSVLRSAFTQVVAKAQALSLINGNIHYDFFIPYLVEAEKVDLHAYYDNRMVIKQFSGRDENEPWFDALAEMFKTSVRTAMDDSDTAITPSSSSKSTRRTRRSASTASTVQCSHPSQ